MSLGTRYQRPPEKPLGEIQGGREERQCNKLKDMVIGQRLTPHMDQSVTTIAKRHMASPISACNKVTNGEVYAYIATYSTYHMFCIVINSSVLG
jgi:hypothetical protein